MDGSNPDVCPLKSNRHESDDDTLNNCEITVLSDSVRNDQEGTETESATVQNQLDYKIKQKENRVKELEQQQEFVLHEEGQRCQISERYYRLDSAETVSDGNISIESSHYFTPQTQTYRDINISTTENSDIIVRNKVEQLICREESKRSFPIEEGFDPMPKLNEETKDPLADDHVEISSELTLTKNQGNIIIDNSNVETIENEQNFSTNYSLTTTEPSAYAKSTKIEKNIHTKDETTKDLDALMNSESQVNSITTEGEDDKVMISTRVKDVVTGYRTLKKNPILATVVWLLGGSTTAVDPITPPLPPQYKRQSSKDSRDSTSSMKRHSSRKEDHRTRGDPRDIARRSTRKNGCTQSSNRRKYKEDDEITYSRIQRDKNNSDVTDFKTINHDDMDNKKNKVRTGLKHPKRLQWNQVTQSGNDVQNCNNLHQQQAVLPHGRKESIMYYYESNDPVTGRDSISSTGSNGRRTSYEEANTSPQWGWYVSLTPPTPNFSQHINTTSTMTK